MKSAFVRFFWAGAIIFVIILATLIGMYFGHNFTGIGPIPTRSAFAGRLPSVPEGNKRRFEFFYASNRINTSESFNAFGNYRGNSIVTGAFNVLITPGMPIKPLVWFEEESLGWVGHKELAIDNFHSKLREKVQASPKKSLLVVVWGYRDWFRSAALKTAYTAYALDINTPVLLFDWPGNQGDGLRGYAAARRIAAESAQDLGKVLVSAINETGAENVWLIGSSLGCQVICDSMAFLSSAEVLNKSEILNKTKLAHVVLSAPDVAADAFDETFATQIKSVSQNLTAYVSSNDRALLMSHWLNGSRRLGRKNEVMVPPKDRTSQFEFEEAIELLALGNQGLKNIFVVDATPLNHLRNLHHFFTDSPEFFGDLYQRLLQPEDIVSRRLHSVRPRVGGGNYWILWSY